MTRYHMARTTLRALFFFTPVTGHRQTIEATSG